MAWLKASITVRDEMFQGFVRRGETVEVTMPWRAGVGKGTIIGIDAVGHKVVSMRDPGNRHETLELDLEALPVRAVKLEAKPVRRRKPAVGAGDGDGE